MSAGRHRSWAARGRQALAAALVLVALSGLAALAHAETVRRGGLQVNFEGRMAPQVLPRSADAPVTVSVSAKVTSTAATPPPPMRQIAIAINRHGHLDTSGLPVCQLEQIQPATTDDALSACRRSLVGQGRFLANVSGRAPFPAEGKIYAFNGEVEGKPAILAHVYGTAPAPASYTLAFVIGKTSGIFGTTLKATLAPVDPDSGYITAIYLTLGKTFKAGGKRGSYFSASCPAPKGLSQAVFSFADAAVSFAGGRTLRSKLTRTCRARG
jgi:hypothetical protein